MNERPSLITNQPTILLGTLWTPIHDPNLVSHLPRLYYSTHDPLFWCVGGRKKEGVIGGPILPGPCLLVCVCLPPPLPYQGVHTATDRLFWYGPTISLKAPGASQPKKEGGKEGRYRLVQSGLGFL